jgi:uncharacterized protein (TIGR00251 family)
MKLTVKVKPSARKNQVKRADDGTLTVHMTVPPIEGKANEMLIELLSEYLKKPKRCIFIVAGFKGRSKIVEIE